jgi:hypothetical protein
MSCWLHSAVYAAVKVVERSSSSMQILLHVVIHTYYSAHYHCQCVYQRIKGHVMSYAYYINRSKLAMILQLVLGIEALRHMCLSCMSYE